jgi:hypothetical protein
MAVRGWGIAAGASFALAVVLAIVGKILESRGLATPAVKTGFIAAAVAAFIVICGSVPPLAVRLFLSRASPPPPTRKRRHSTCATRPISPTGS